MVWQQQASQDVMALLQETLALAAPAPSLAALSSTSRLRMLRLCDASMLSNRITGAPAVALATLACADVRIKTLYMAFSHSQLPRGLT